MIESVPEAVVRSAAVTLADCLVSAAVSGAALYLVLHPERRHQLVDVARRAGRRLRGEVDRLAWLGSPAARFGQLQRERMIASEWSIEVPA